MDFAAQSWESNGEVLYHPMLGFAKKNPRKTQIFPKRYLSKAQGSKNHQKKQNQGLPPYGLVYVKGSFWVLIAGYKSGVSTHRPSLATVLAAAGVLLPAFSEIPAAFSKTGIMKVSGIRSNSQKHPKLTSNQAHQHLEAPQKPSTNQKHLDKPPTNLFQTRLGSGAPPW